MRLADFIREHMEAILADWEDFAATRSPAAVRMTRIQLRDHAQQILEAVARDLSRPESEYARREKSQGRAPLALGAPETAAETHAVLRRSSGFDINQLVAEYRALRASVLHLWKTANDGEPRHLEDVIRFNEAIDQALTESVTFYSAQVERSRTLLLAMVGHDMRNPLNTIQMSAGYLARLEAGPEVAAATKRLLEGGSRLRALLDDMLDFNRSRLGLGLRITPAPIDLADSVSREVAQLRAAYPKQAIELAIEGELTGDWDERRLQQVLANLVSNAVKYGMPNAPIRIHLTGAEDNVVLTVTNAGHLHDSADFDLLFEPLQRGPDAGDAHGTDSLGLGLYIAREITHGHGGQISVDPQPEATVFTVSLPRRHEGSNA